MQLFYGANQEVLKPIYGFGTSYNDCGTAFYLTEYKEFAAEWASQHNEQATVNVYNIALDSLKCVDMTKYNVLYWVTMLLKYRKISGWTREQNFLFDNFDVDIENMDYVYSYRCDDGYFDIVKSFVDDEIGAWELEEALKSGYLGEQYALKSEKAHQSCLFQESYPIEWKHYQPTLKRRRYDATETLKTLKKVCRDKTRDGKEVIYLSNIMEDQEYRDLFTV